MNTMSYDQFLQEELRDPQLAAEYLTAAVEDGEIEPFLIALRNVAEAHGGVGAIAETALLNRQGTYRMLSRAGNPTLSSLLPVLRAMGLPAELARSSLRFSLGRDNTAEEMDRAAAAVAQVVAGLRTAHTAGRL